jgi:hypothetical protein
MGNRNLDSYKSITTSNKYRLSDANIITRGDVCLSRKRLTKLPHFKYVSGDFDCRDNNLTYLEVH